VTATIRGNMPFFKRINDLQSHREGDAALGMMANLMSEMPGGRLCWPLGAATSSAACCRHERRSARVWAERIRMAWGRHEFSCRRQMHAAPPRFSAWPNEGDDVVDSDELRDCGELKVVLAV